MKNGTKWHANSSYMFCSVNYILQLFHVSNPHQGHVRSFGPSKIQNFWRTPPPWGHDLIPWKKKIWIMVFISSHADRGNQKRTQHIDLAGRGIRIRKNLLYFRWIVDQTEETNLKSFIHSSGTHRGNENCIIFRLRNNIPEQKNQKHIWKRDGIKTFGNWEPTEEMNIASLHCEITSPNRRHHIRPTEDAITIHLKCFINYLTTETPQINDYQKKQIHTWYTYEWKIKIWWNLLYILTS